ncbi:hypothetical protein EON82_25610, partial [bacterium]
MIGYAKKDEDYACQKYLGQRTTRVETVDLAGTTIYREEIRVIDGVRTRVPVFDKYTFTRAQCDAERDRIVAAIKRSLPAVSEGQEDGVGLMTSRAEMDTTTSHDLNDGIRKCKVTVLDIPTIGATTCRRKVDDTTLPIYERCEADSRSFRECPSVGYKVYSPTNLTLQSLVGTFPKAITTPEPACLSADNEPETRAKYARLNLTAIRGGGGRIGGPAYTAAVHDYVLASLKLLLELHGDELQENERERILELYARYPAWPSCADASKTAPPPNVTCNASPSDAAGRPIVEDT